jgi:hypothetical protein
MNNILYDLVVALNFEINFVALWFMTLFRINL